MIYWPVLDFYGRIWSNRLDEDQLRQISWEMQRLHKVMKNIIEFVFATSPLLALSGGGWTRSIQGASLLRVSDIFNVFFLFS
jgi:hypothetical protein